MLFMRSTGFIQSNLVRKYQQATCTLMDVRDVAALLRVSKSMVYKLAEQGTLHAVRIGRLVRFTRSDVNPLVRSGVS